MNAPAKLDVLAALDRWHRMAEQGEHGDAWEAEAAELAATRTAVADLLTAAREFVAARIEAHAVLDRKAFVQARRRVNLAEIAIAGALSRIAP